MEQKKQFLEDKFVQFQLEIDELKRANSALQETNENQFNTMILNFIKLLDFIDNINDNISHDDKFEPIAQQLIKNVKTLEKKLNRILRSNKIAEISFPDNIATREQSKIIDTVINNQRTAGAIVETLKKGYINQVTNKIIRKAELITIVHH